MTKVDKKLLLSVAKNARLNLTEKEIKILLPQFKEILKTFDIISKVNVKGVKEAFHPVEVKNVWREDIEQESISQKDALSNTKHKKNGYFKGPKVI